MSHTMLSELNDLHASYVEAINIAVSEDDLARADELAASYDIDAIQLIAEWEDKSHLLPIKRPTDVDTPLRRLVRRLTVARAA